MSLWTPPEVPKEMPCEKCGELTPYKGLIGAGRLPCVHCGAPHPHTPLRTGCWPTIFLIFFVAVFPVAPSVLLAVLFARHPRGGRVLVCSLRHGIRDKGRDDPGAGGDRGHGAPRLCRPVPGSNSGPVGRSCRAGGKGRPGEKLFRGIGAGQGCYPENLEKEKNRTAASR